MHVYLCCNFSESKCRFDQTWLFLVDTCTPQKRDFANGFAAKINFSKSKIFLYTSPVMKHAK